MGYRIPYLRGNTKGRDHVYWAMQNTGSVDDSMTPEDMMKLSWRVKKWTITGNIVFKCKYQLAKELPGGNLTWAIMTYCSESTMTLTVDFSDVEMPGYKRLYPTAGLDPHNPPFYRVFVQPDEMDDPTAFYMQNERDVIDYPNQQVTEWKNSSDLTESPVQVDPIDYKQNPSSPAFNFLGGYFPSSGNAGFHFLREEEAEQDLDTDVEIRVNESLVDFRMMWLTRSREGKSDNSVPLKETGLVKFWTDGPAFANFGTTPMFYFYLNCLIRANGRGWQPWRPDIPENHTDIDDEFLTWLARDTFEDPFLSGNPGNASMTTDSDTIASITTLYFSNHPLGNYASTPPTDINQTFPNLTNTDADFGKSQILLFWNKSGHDDGGSPSSYQFAIFGITAEAVVHAAVSPFTTRYTSVEVELINSNCTYAPGHWVFREDDPPGSGYSDEVDVFCLMRGPDSVSATASSISTLAGSEEEVGTLDIFGTSIPIFGPTEDMDEPVGFWVDNCDLTLTPVEWWPYANSAGEPIYDTSTGEQLRDPFG